jgi:hypothetical protein
MRFLSIAQNLKAWCYDRSAWVYALSIPDLVRAAGKYARGAEKGLEPAAALTPRTPDITAPYLRLP